MLIRDIIPPKRKIKKRLFPKIITLLLVIILITPFFVGTKGSAAEFVATKKTPSGYSKFTSQLQVVGTKIYYVWQGYDDLGSLQIWTGEMNINGSGWSATQRTTSEYNKEGPQLQVVGSKIYYAWFENSPIDSIWGMQIWTAEMNTDGSGWTVTQQTLPSKPRDGLQFQISGSKIYYVWSEPEGLYFQIWTAEMNTDGSGWSVTQRTASVYEKGRPQLQVVGTKIYYVWHETDDSSYSQIWTAEMNTDGSGWSVTQRTASEYNKSYPQFQVVENNIYYVWYETDDSSYSQIWTAEMNTDGTGWVATQRTISPFNKWFPQLQVVGDKIYLVGADQSDVSYTQWFTAEMNVGGTGWTYATRTSTPYEKETIQFQATGSRIYYIWSESDDFGDYQLWTGEMGFDLPGISGLLPPSPEEIPPTPPPEQPPIIGKTIEEMKREDILKQMNDVLTQINQLYTQLIQIFKR